MAAVSSSEVCDLSSCFNHTDIIHQLAPDACVQEIQAAGAYLSLLSVLQKPLARFVRVVLVVPLFMGCFSGRENDSGTVHKVYVTLARILGCFSLFFFANVLKALAAKLMATSFHQETHFKKMQEALQKVRACVLLCLWCHACCSKIRAAALDASLENAVCSFINSKGEADCILGHQAKTCLAHLHSCRISLVWLLLGCMLHSP